MPTTIIGVDFSGAIANDPWVTRAAFQNGGLMLESCFPLPREELTERLLALCGNPNAVVGMDFPFGLPTPFAKAEFKFEGTLMPEMWEIIAKQDNLAKYIADIRPRLRRTDLRRFNNCQRQWDKMHFPGVALSPLKPARPEMFPMTFYGMKMLHTLWDESDCKVPPLDDAGRNGATLLETMPGAVLWRFGFERSVYKGYKNGASARSRRKEIVKHLPSKSEEFGVQLENLDRFSDLCIGVHDCLDSAVAAIAAAIWAKDKTLFHRPQDHQDPAVLEAAKREGCIYVPRPVNT